MAARTFCAAESFFQGYFPRSLRTACTIRHKILFSEKQYCLQKIHKKPRALARGFFDLPIRFRQACRNRSGVTMLFLF